MATKYELSFQVCSDIDGNNPVFNITIPFYVYGTDEWTTLKTHFQATYGTGEVVMWRDNPIALTEAGQWAYANLPHLTDSLINIANDSAAVNWYNAIMAAAPSMGANLSNSFKQLPIRSTSGGGYERRSFYLKRIKDSNMFSTRFTFASYNTNASAADQRRENSFMSESPDFHAPILQYGSGNGQAGQNYYTLTQRGLFIVSDDFNGRVDGNTVYWSEISGYLNYSGATSKLTIQYTLSHSSYNSVLDLLRGIEIEPYTPPPTDPYADGGFSGTGGGDGTFDLQNDSIDFPSLPALSAVDTGLVSIYTPSLAQLKSLATFLWNANPTDVDWWKKLVANPLDLILGLSIVPVQVPAGSAQTIKVGLIDTGVSVTKAASQFVTVDCGSVTIQKNCGGSALDYSPFTKFSLYLPFIGTRTISCDDIMGRTVHVKYNVDLLSGGCTAMVKITGGPDDNQLDAILYQYSGACAISIPLTGETFTNMITSTIQLAASIGATVATGGAAAGVSAASAANSLMSMKPIVERAGGVSGAAGQLGIMQPYLIAEVPRQSVPTDCNKFTGYPSNIKATIGDLTGYTEVEIVYLQGIEATQAELDELESVLKGGFII